jgi:hypothetical protein
VILLYNCPNIVAIDEENTFKMRDDEDEIENGATNLSIIDNRLIIISYVIFSIFQHTISILALTR